MPDLRKLGTDTLDDLKKGLPNLGKLLLEPMKKIGTDTLDDLKKGLPIDDIVKLVDMVNTLPGKIMEKLKALPGTFKEKLRDTIKQIITNLKGGMGKMISDLAKQAIG